MMVVTVVMMVIEAVGRSGVLREEFYSEVPMNFKFPSGLYLHLQSFLVASDEWEAERCGFFDPDTERRERYGVSGHGFI